MNWDLRKTVVGVASLAGLIIVYLIYARSFHTPPIPVHAPDSGLEAFDANHPNGGTGRIGSLNVGPVKRVVYEDRDDQGRLVRTWGFDDLWHGGQDVWEVKKPFVMLYLEDANCAITADGGRFTVRSGQVRPSPTDGTLSGHVEVQIQPHPGARTPACQVHLDDITFVGTTSRFTSTGRIEFASEAVQWTGRKAEFLYNDQARRLEYFHLAHLDSLVLRWPKEQSRTGDAGPEPQQGGQTPQDQSYQCLVRDRVWVQTAQQAVYVRQYLLLTELPWSGSLAGGRDKTSDQPDPHPGADAATGAREWTEITVACDGPMLVAPSGTPLPADVQGPGEPAGPAGRQPLKDLGWFSSDTLQVNARTRDAVAEGPVEIRFLAKDAPAKGATGLVPVRITAETGASYDGLSSRLVLEGPCLATLVREQDAITERVSLAAPRLIADLVEDPNRQTLVAAQDVRRVQAGGGSVEVRAESKAGDDATVLTDPGKTMEGPLASGARLICTQLDWDLQSPGQVITALGPGTVWLNHSAPRKAERGADKDQPFYALLRQFETLQFLMADHRLLAEGRSQPMLVDYFPTVEGRTDPHIHAEANGVQIDLARRPDLRDLDLVRLNATGNVYYDDQEHRFAANQMTYDHTTHWMDMTGKEDEPCSADGVPVRGIRFNLKTQQLQTQVVAPTLWLVH